MKYLIRVAAVAAIFVASSLLGGEKASPMVAGTPGYIDTLFAMSPDDRILDVAVTDDGRRVAAVSLVDDLVYEFVGGQLRRVAGCFGDCVDGSTLANQQPLVDPHSVAFDSAGNLYVSESYACRIQRVATDGTMTLFAGSPVGECGHDGDGGSASSAILGVVSSIAISDSDVLYLSQIGSEPIPASCHIRRVSGGIIETIAGTGPCGSTGDGGAAASAEVQPYGLTLATDGSVYFADFCRIRVIAAGVISTIAGTGDCGYAGDGGFAVDAQLQPRDVAVDSAGVVYIADSMNCGIRRIADGIISPVTVLGLAGCGFQGDGASASAAKMDFPEGIAIDDAGNLYIADNRNGRVRVIYGADALDSDGDAYPDVVETGMGEDPFSYCAAMRADIDDDGVVSILDLTVVAGSFLKAVPAAPGRIDQDGDGVISILDLSRMATAFARPVSSCA